MPAKSLSRSSTGFWYFIGSFISFQLRVIPMYVYISERFPSSCGLASFFPITVFRYVQTVCRLKHSMGVFQSNKFRSSSYNASAAARYRVALSKHPFALFGLPFIATMVLGSFFLTPASALRYERHDRKVRQVTEEERLGMSKDKRKIDIRDEYYRLSAKDLHNWEQKRIKRLPGEPDGVL